MPKMISDVWFYKIFSKRWQFNLNPFSRITFPIFCHFVSSSEEHYNASKQVVHKSKIKRSVVAYTY